MSDWAIVFAGIGGAAGDLSYDAGEASKPGGTRHVITGLPPSQSFAVSGGGGPVRELKSSPQGLLVFTTAVGGRIDVAPR